MKIDNLLKAIQKGTSAKKIVGDTTYLVSKGTPMKIEKGKVYIVHNGKFKHIPELSL